MISLCLLKDFETLIDGIINSLNLDALAPPAHGHVRVPDLGLVLVENIAVGRNIAAVVQRKAVEKPNHPLVQKLPRQVIRYIAFAADLHLLVLAAEKSYIHHPEQIR